MTRATGLSIGLGVAAACAVAAHLAGLDEPAVATAAVTGLCAAWWVLAPIPIPATSLIPFAAFPLLGVLPHGAVANAYGHTLILLLLGGFMLSMAVEKSGVHRRMALGMVRAAGGGGRRLIGGFMLASALCSMWISNTATVLMLLPVALAVIEADTDRRLAVPLLLGIAYAASIGGLATPVGTPPNVIFMGIYEETTGEAVSFLQWMKIGVPATLVLLPVAWLHLGRGLGDARTPAIPGCGVWRPAEVRVMVVFACTAAAWIFREEPLGGWSGLLGVPGVGDSTVALAAVVVMFLVPDGEGGQLLDWEQAREIPWGLLILFGGGIALSAGFEASGLSDALGRALAGLASWPLVAMIFMICLAVTFMTEVTSNTATTTLLMPLLAAAALAAHLDPRVLMVPAALSASCAFMLPVATAPNAIVAGTEHISTGQMARTGLALNLAGAVILTGVCWVLL